MPLRALGTLVSGSSLRPADLADEPPGAPYISGPHQLRPDGGFEITRWARGRYRAAPADCVFIVMKGSVGKVFRGTAGAIGRDLAAFVPHSPLDLGYVLLALQDRAGYWGRNARGHIPGITRALVLDEKIGVPPLSEQLEIAQTASEIEARLIEANRLLTMATDRMGEMHQQTLSHILQAGDRTSVLLSQKAEPRRDVRLLSEVADLRTGHTPSRTSPEYWDGETPWVGIADARDAHGSVVTSTKRSITEAGIASSSAVKLPADTVCLSRTASVGYVVRLGATMATSQDFANWICSDKVSPRWLQLVLMSSVDYLKSLSKGATIRTIYMRDLERLCILLPPTDVQTHRVERADRFLASFQALSDLALRARQQIEEIEVALRTRAVHGALTGRPTNDDVERLLAVLKPNATLDQEREQPTMAPRTILPLLDVLSNEPDGLAPEVLFERAGYTPEQVERYFDDLIALVANGLAQYTTDIDRVRRVH